MKKLSRHEEGYFFFTNNLTRKISLGEEREEVDLQEKEIHFKSEVVYGSSKRKRKIGQGKLKMREDKVKKKGGDI